jgi:uncharacterized YigZ family protein
MEHLSRMIAVDGEHEIEIRKSRFICSLSRVASEEEAREVIERVRKARWNANHNCSAWRIGDGGRFQRSNDDGEPSGTAGVPMLEVLRRLDLTDVVAVVTRYFGGVMLGAGGLIRAYGGAVSAAIEAIGVVERRPLHVTRLWVSHADAGRIENALRASAFPLDGVSYEAEGVNFTLHLEDREVTEFTTWAAAATNGLADVRDNGVVYVEVPVEA